MRAALTLAVISFACASNILPGKTHAAELVIFPSQPPPPINSLAFAVQTPLPGRPGYLETIKFVADGVRYIDPLSHFYISAAGEMCFHTPPSNPKIYTDAYYKDWCIHPYVVDRVSVIDFSNGAHGVEMWCMRAYPACAHALETGEVANRVFAESINYRQERAALRELIYMMGGNVPLSGFQQSRELPDRPTDLRATDGLE